MLGFPEIHSKVRIFVSLLAKNLGQPQNNK